jgi:hypothetical protein
MQKRRIPATLIAFSDYLHIANVHLHTIASGDTLPRGEVLGMTPAEMLTLQHFKMVWSSGDPLHPGVWDLHSQKDKKTAATRQNVLQVMSDFSAFFRPILVRISACPAITVDDRLVLNIAPPVTKRSRPTLEIGEKCVTDHNTLGGARIKFKCKTPHDSTRASIPPRANAVELAYKLVLPYQFTPAGKKIPADMISGPYDGTTMFMSTRASFMIEFDQNYLGYQIQFYTRWINTRHPNLNGPWTGPLVGYIG